MSCIENIDYKTMHIALLQEKACGTLRILALAREHASSVFAAIIFHAHNIHARLHA